MKQMVSLRNEKGLLTLDLIFASLIVFSFSAIMFSFAMTFSIVEVVQYMSYSTARNYSLAHASELTQQERGQEKFNQLRSAPVFQSIFSLGWFELRDVQMGDFNEEYNPGDYRVFWGARIPVSIPILYKRIPALGATADGPDGFTANIQSFLLREPTFEECQGFNQARTQALSTLAQSPTGFDPNAVALIMDNGC